MKRAGRLADSGRARPDALDDLVAAKLGDDESITLRDITMLILPALLVNAVAITSAYQPHPGGIAILLVVLALLTAIVSA